MNFKNQISTTCEQSERLLALGVKPETADMNFYKGYLYLIPYPSIDQEGLVPIKLRENDLPSWSLSRLLEMMPQYIDEKEEVLLMIDPPIVSYYDTKYRGQHHFTTSPNIFDNCVAMIDWLIRNGHFNKEYLAGKEEKGNDSLQ